MPKIVDHSDVLNRKFNQLTVVEVMHNDGKHFWYRCVCDCGNDKYMIRRSQLFTGTTLGCGCQQRKHGLTGSIEYTVWIDMKQRCLNGNSESYGGYGSRGIVICDRWLHPEEGFLNFLEDMGPRKSLSYTIERVDVNGNYCPENCIWTDDPSLQSYNKRKRGHNTSGRTGVSYDGTIKSSKKWKAQIVYKDSRKSKRFQTFEEALKQRAEWELELYGFNVE